MNHDLQSALDELAARVELSHRASGRLPVEAIAARAHHKRRTRAALITTGAAAGVILLAGTAFAVLPDRTPAPPAHTVSPTSTPTSTPTASTAPSTTPTVLPAGDASLPFGACGSLVDAAPALPRTDLATASVLVGVPTIEAGAPLGVQASVGLSFVDDVALISPGAGPRFAVSHDGVVVAVGDVYGGQDRDLQYQSFGGESAPVTFAGWLDLAVCDVGDGSGTPGRALPGGTYEVRAWAEVATIAVATPDLFGTQTLEELDASADARHAAVVGDPVTFEVVGAATTPAPHPTADGPLLAPSSTAPAVTCGEPLPDDLGGSPQFQLTAAPSVSTVSQGEAFDLVGTLVYTGPDRALASVRQDVDLVVARDGTVVGADEFSGYFSPPVDLGHGASLALDGSYSAWRLTGCAGEPLPPGVYTVYPRVAVTRVGLRADPEDWSPGGPVVGRPFVVTVT